MGTIPRMTRAALILFFSMKDVLDRLGPFDKKGMPERHCRDAKREKNRCSRVALRSQNREKSRRPV